MMRITLLVSFLFGCTQPVHSGKAEPPASPAQMDSVSASALSSASVPNDLDALEIIKKTRKPSGKAGFPFMVKVGMGGKVNLEYSIESTAEADEAGELWGKYGNTCPGLAGVETAAHGSSVSYFIYSDGRCVHLISVGPSVKVPPMPNVGYKIVVDKTHGGKVSYAYSVDPSGKIDPKELFQQNRRRCRGLEEFLKSDMWGTANYVLSSDGSCVKTMMIARDASGRDIVSH